MSKRKIIKWTLAISKTDEDDICLPFGTSVDTDTYGDNYRAVNVVDIAVVFKLIQALRENQRFWNCMDEFYDENVSGDGIQYCAEISESANTMTDKALKLADIIMDEFTDKLEEKV